jgi:hypothetical protein
MQADVVKLAIDLLVRRTGPGRIFGALTKTMVEEGESVACGVWLIDETGQRCDLWMAYEGSLVLASDAGMGCRPA